MSELPACVRPCPAAAFLSGFMRCVGTATIAVMLAVVLLVGSSSLATAAADRSLKLFFTHTGERATITFKRGGKFDARGLGQINRFLRDWRKNEPANIDPRLLDLVWEVYQRSGSNDYIHIVSAYRSPGTNKMLRGRSRDSGVAKKQSTHPRQGDGFLYSGRQTGQAAITCNADASWWSGLLSGIGISVCPS